VRLSIFGLGNVGRALLRSFERIQGSDMRLVCAADSRGAFLAPIYGRLKPELVLARKAAGDYDPLPAGATIRDLLELIRPDIHVELTPTNLEDGQPAEGNIRRALELGIPVVTAAKSHQRSVECMRRIDGLAREVSFLDHASMLAGIPVTEMMAGIGMKVTRIAGVLNGTTNYILARLEAGASFTAALDEAIEKGFAERNWRYDVEGNDTAIKLVGLTKKFFGRYLEAGAFEIGGLGPDLKGLDGLSPERVAELRVAGRKLKLFGEVELIGDEVQAKVYPREFELTDPYAHIDGFQNAIEIDGVMNEQPMRLFLTGPGAGADETASRVLGNLNHLIQMMRIGADPRCRFTRHGD